MPKHSNIPPAILSFVKKSFSTTERRGDHEEDSAFLLPSNGSSFNLTGDSENLQLSKSTSHHSNHSKSSKSSSRAASPSRASSGGSGHRRHRSGSSGSGHIHHRRGSGSSGSGHRHHQSSNGGGGGGGDGKKKKRSSRQQREFDPSHYSSPSSAHLSERSSPHTQHRSGLPQGRRGSHRNYPESESLDFALRKISSAVEQDADGYLVGYDSDNINGALSPIASTSNFSEQTSNNSEHDRSTRSIKSPFSSSHTIHSGKSYKSQKSATNSNRSRKTSHRRGKLKREEKRREWVQRWRRRRLVGKMVLTSIYSILLAYTLLITLGPLALHFGDPMEWCPYYNDELLEGFHYDEIGPLNIDQLQRSRQLQQEVGNEQQGRRLTSRRETSSKDVHSNKNDGSNNKKQNGDAEQLDSGESSSKYENPDYDDSPCRTIRIPSLFYLTLEECDLSRRMAISVLLGGFIGYERRASDRPAGIRTMALVSLGSCFFTISSQLAFRDSPMTWDSSRVTAAIPSGVGFLGAGLIWKGSLSDGSGGEVHQVHGITTAASVWLAAAIGVGAGGALYAVSAYSTALIILVLRFGPRLYLQNDRGFEDDDEEEDEEDEVSESENDRKYDKVPEERIPVQTANYEMHQMGHQSTLCTNDATTLENNNATRYGATDVEQNMVAQLLQEDQRRQVERMNRPAINGNSNDGSQFLSWLTKLLPGKERQQPVNPYQEITRDREVMRLMKKKKSMGRMSSRPSFCT